MLALLGLGLAGCSPSKPSPEFEVEGVIRAPAGPLATFLVCVRGTEWLIRSTPVQPSGRAPRFVEAGSLTGGQWVQTSVYPASQVTRAFLESNTVPVAVQGQMTHLWLIYCAGAYLDAQGTNGLPPVYDFAAATASPAEKRPARWQRDSAPPRLPTEITFLNPGQRRVRDAAGVRLIRHPPPFDQGFTEARYAVTGLTNVGRWPSRLTLPTGFVFERFWPRPAGQRSTDLDVTERLEVEVQAVRAQCARASLLPSPTQLTAVTDRRLLQGDFALGEINYELRTNQWPTIRELYAIEAKQRLSLAKQQTNPLRQFQLGYDRPLPKGIPPRPRLTARHYVLYGASLFLAGSLLFQGLARLQTWRRSARKPSPTLHERSHPDR